MIREDVRNLNMVYRDIFGTFYTREGNHMSYFNTNIRRVQSQVGIFKKSDCSSSCSWFSMRLQIVNISDLGLGRNPLWFCPRLKWGKIFKTKVLKYDDIWFCRKVLPIPLKKNPRIIIIIKEKVLSCQNSLSSLVKEEYIICDSCAYHLNRQI